MTSMQSLRQPLGLSNWRRAFEWALVAAVILVLAVVFVRHMRAVQGQSEQAAVRTTLGALRTALVIEHLQHSLTPIGGLSTARPPRSPFDLLQYRTANYIGIVNSRKALIVPPGSWVYDPVCPCIGYRPLDDLWLNSPSGEPMAWFLISGAPGPLQLTARENYLWQDQLLD